MRNIILPIAFISVLGMALPMASTAKAEEGVSVRIGDRDHDRDHWRHREHRKVVVIKHDRRHHDRDYDHD
jgi:hypothetical protein